jgi:hypothetical protein
LVTAGGAACSTKHQAPGPAAGVCVDEPANAEEDPVEVEELAANDAPPSKADECTGPPPAEQQLAER